MKRTAIALAWSLFGWAASFVGGAAYDAVMAPLPEPTPACQRLLNSLKTDPEWVVTDTATLRNRHLGTTVDRGFLYASVSVDAYTSADRRRIHQEFDAIMGSIKNRTDRDELDALDLAMTKRREARKLEQEAAAKKGKCVKAE